MSPRINQSKKILQYTSHYLHLCTVVWRFNQNSSLTRLLSRRSFQKEQSSHDLLTSSLFEISQWELVCLFSCLLVVSLVVRVSCISNHRILTHNALNHNLVHSLAQWHWQNQHLDFRNSCTQLFRCW